MLVLDAPYVPGATKVLLKGKVTSVDSASGKLTLGKQVVDYSDLLSKVNVRLSRRFAYRSRYTAAR